MPQDSPLLFVISGPSGSGKGTLLEHLSNTFPDLRRVQTYTTRAPRPNETSSDYHFVSQPEFDSLVASGALFEYTRTYEDFCYGSPRILVEDNDSADLVVELEVKGMLRMKAMSRRRVVSIFVMPKSIEDLKARILARHAEDNFDARIKKATDQLAYTYAFDFLAINDDREEFLRIASEFVQAERERRKGFQFIAQNMSELLRS